MNSRLRILLTRRWTEAVERYLATRCDVTLNPTDVPLTAEQPRRARRTLPA
jgi:hypothetical protein